MSTSYDPYDFNAYGLPDPLREPIDPLLALPDHPSGEWATAARRRPPQRIGHPRPARQDPGPAYFGSPVAGDPYPLLAEAQPAAASAAPRRSRTPT
jgi:putative serine protease PepD